MIEINNTGKLLKCNCQKPPFYFDDYNIDRLGEDFSGAEVSVWTCKQCGLMWLNYLIEEPHNTRAGRWWRVVVSPEQKMLIATGNARDFVQAQNEAYVGGSYFNSSGKKINKPITII